MKSDNFSYVCEIVEVTDLFRTEVNFFKAAVEDLQICWISIKHLFSHQSVKGNQKKREKEEGNNQNNLLSENSTPVPTNQLCSKINSDAGGGLNCEAEKEGFFLRFKTVAAIFQAMLLKAPKLQKA
ncbi:hypothetical protein V6N12_070792 [Hibiscus sabdariffa]|uniref:Uncharacterized protein n=1 Tax=Hibiscus sabdariffa TaxID=183260 RepID=A0ABR2FHW2_9ROSI